MSATYLVRFDDLHPAMDWAAWSVVESIVDAEAIRPIVAVIPANRDPSLVMDEPNTEFWERARGWQRKGWAIGLHGHEHVYDSENAGLVGLRTKSEFAGWSADVQRERLGAGVAALESHGLRPDLFVAPGHTFDSTTVSLLRSFGLAAISDGWTASPVEDAFGVVWLPQQLWDFKRRPFGVWTVCLHHNGWSQDQLHKFAAQIKRWEGRIGDPFDALASGRGRAPSMVDRLASTLLPLAHRTRSIVAGRISR